MEKQYEFVVVLIGYGETKNDAWIDACKALSADMGEPPDDDYTIERGLGDFHVD